MGFAVLPTDADIALGRVPGFLRCLEVNGVSTALASNVPEDVWQGGGLYPWPASADVMRVRSSDAQDNPLGTGIGIYRVQYLDSEWGYHEADITLDGTNWVNGPTFTRILSARPAPGIGAGAASTTGENAGAIEFEQVGSPGVTLAFIPAGQLTTQLGLTSTPSDAASVLTSITVNI